MKKKYHLYLLILTVMIMGVISIATSYSLWAVTKVQVTNNVIHSGCFDITLEEDENLINLDNIYPINDEKGKSLDPYTFTISNICSIDSSYTINLEMLNETDLSTSFVNLMINNDIKLLSEYDEALPVLEDTKESRILLTDTLKANANKKYSLRLWMDKRVTVNDNAQGKKLKAKISVVAVPTTTKLVRIVNGSGTDIGDEVCIDKECFFVIGNDTTNLTMLSKYNLDVGSKCLWQNNTYVCSEIVEPIGLQYIGSLGYTNETYNTTGNYGVTSFASSSYKGIKNSSYAGSLASVYVDLYKEKLNKMGASIISASLITISELENLGCSIASSSCASSYDFVTTSSYWTSTPSNDDCVYLVNSNKQLLPGGIYNDIGDLGIRPIIKMPISKLSE